MRFADRREAGRRLAEKLRRYAGREDVLVLALPRGGVPVGFEVARELGAALDVMIVRKLGVPGHEELAMGAVASGGVRVLSEEIIAGLRVPQSAIEEVAAREAAELARRERLYRGGRPAPEVQGKTVILVDDGIATGATMRAAARALRKLGPARLVVAAPTGAPDSVAALEQQADEVVCLDTPEPFVAVGVWYDRFPQLSDAEVRALLAEAARLPVGPSAPRGRGQP